jgi:hypothetical protein
MITALLAAGFLLAADSPATPPADAVTARDAKAAAAQAASNPDQMVCVKTKVLGTRFPKTECRTRAEWRQLTQDSKDVLDGIQRSRSGNPGTGG